MLHAPPRILAGEPPEHLTVRNAGGEAPIHLAAAHPHGLRFVKETMEKVPSAATWTTHEDKTPLFYALQDRKQAHDMIDALLPPDMPPDMAAAVVNRQTRGHCWTALHLACMQINDGAILSLLQHKADPNVKVLHVLYFRSSYAPAHCCVTSQCLQNAFTGAGGGGCSTYAKGFPQG